MSKPVVLVEGIVRGSRPLRKRGAAPDAAPFAYEVSVMTQAGPSVLGGELNVVIFVDNDTSTDMITPGNEVTWAVALSSSAEYGLSATYRADLALTPVAA